MKTYVDEREGQIEFFEKFNIDYKNNPVLVDNTDGVWNGNIFEFKVNLSNINRALFQAIKYLSKLRVKGQSVPSKISLSIRSTNDFLLSLINFIRAAYSLSLLHCALSILIKYSKF